MRRAGLLSCPGPCHRHISAGCPRATGFTRRRARNAQSTDRSGGERSSSNFLSRAGGLARSCRRSQSENAPRFAGGCGARQECLWSGWNGRSGLHGADVTGQRHRTFHTGCCKRQGGEIRGKLAVIRPTPAPVVKPLITVDTAKLIAQHATAQQNYVTAARQAEHINQKNARIDRESAHARELANVGAPPWAMLAAAVVLALAVGFAASFGTELKRPHIADPRETEQVSGARVLTVIKPPEVVVERSRRQADVEAPPLIDVVSESYRTLYLHIASVEASVPIVTITGDDPAIVATVAANLAASAAYEARSTLLVDVDPTTCSVASVLRIRPDPGLSGIITGSCDLARSDRSDDDRADSPLRCPSERDQALGIARARCGRRGTERARANATAVRFHYYRGSHELRSAKREQHHPAPDVILCARIAHTTVGGLKISRDQPAWRRHAHPWPRALGCRRCRSWRRVRKCLGHTSIRSLSARACHGTVAVDGRSNSRSARCPEGTGLRELQAHSETILEGIG